MEALELELMTEVEVRLLALSRFSGAPVFVCDLVLTQESLGEPWGVEWMGPGVPTWAAW